MYVRILSPCLLKIWALFPMNPYIHFVIFSFLLQCSDGLYFNHQQSAYKRQNTLGIFSKIVFISVHTNEHSLLNKIAGVCKSRCLIIYLFSFFKRICIYRKWQREQIIIFYTTLGKYLARKKHIKGKERMHIKTYTNNT